MLRARGVFYGSGLAVGGTHFCVIFAAEPHDKPHNGPGALFFSHTHDDRARRTLKEVTTAVMATAVAAMVATVRTDDFCASEA